MRIKHSKSANNALPNLSDSDEITRLYKMYRSDFISFGVKHFPIDRDVVAEIYQDSFMAMYNNLIHRRLTSLTCSLKTYLTEIGKRKMMNYVRNKKGLQNVDLHDNYTAEPDHNPEWEQRQEITCQVVFAMKEPCSSVLTMFFWERRSMVEIARQMSYKNEQVAKNRKSLCMKKLKELLSAELEREDYYDY